jgi:glucosylceramidase
LQEYKKNDINIWAVTAQNEPSDGYIYDFKFSAMGFTPETQAQFISENLGPTLEKNGFEQVKIMILDDDRILLPAWPQRVKFFIFTYAHSYS